MYYLSLFLCVYLPVSLSLSTFVQLVYFSMINIGYNNNNNNNNNQISIAPYGCNFKDLHRKIFQKFCWSRIFYRPMPFLMCIHNAQTVDSDPKYHRPSGLFLNAEHMLHHPKAIRRRCALFKRYLSHFCLLI